MRKAKALTHTRVLDCYNMELCSSWPTPEAITHKTLDLLGFGLIPCIQLQYKGTLSINVSGFGKTWTLDLLLNQ